MNVANGSWITVRDKVCRRNSTSDNHDNSHSLETLGKRKLLILRPVLRPEGKGLSKTIMAKAQRASCPGLESRPFVSVPRNDFSNNCFFPLPAGIAVVALHRNYREQRGTAETNVADVLKGDSRFLGCGQMPLDPLKESL